MQLRRALFLFLSVMFISAMAASLVRQPAPRISMGTDATEAETATGARSTPSAEPGPSARAREIEVEVGERPRRLALVQGSHVVLTVASDRPGEVAIADLGLRRALTPRTPASFDLLLRRAGSFDISFSPTAGGQSQPVATLDVEPPATRGRSRPRA